MAANIIFAALSLILNCPGLKLAVAVYKDRIYIKEVFIRHRVLSKIILDRDLRFIVIF